MIPAFLLLADSADVTGTIADRLISLTVTDEDGRSADRLALTLDNRDGLVELPQVGVTLDLWLGWRGAPLVPMGRFAVDRLSGERPPQTLTIEATAADMTGPLRQPKTRAWVDITLSDLVETIAAEAGMRAAVSAALAGVRWPVIAQTAESDLNLLARLARHLDATAKPAGGALVVVGRGEGVNAAGDPITAVPLPVDALQRYRWEQSERQTYASVEAEFSDIASGTTVQITIGSGDPVRRLRHVYATRAEAIRAGRAELAMAGRARITLDAEIATFGDDLFAGGTTTITGLAPALDGDWRILRVEHRLATSLTTTISAERTAE